MGPNDKALAESEPARAWYRRIVGIGFPLINEMLEGLPVIWGGAHHCSRQEVLEEPGDNMLSARMAHLQEPVDLAMADRLAVFIQTLPLDPGAAPSAWARWFLAEIFSVIVV